MNFVDRFLKFLKYIKNKLVIMVRGKKLSEEKERALREAYKSAYEESPIEAKKILRELGGEESTITDEIREFLEMDFTKESSFKFFRKLFQILKKTEKDEIYTFISDEVYRGWTIGQLKDEIEKTKDKEDELLKLKFKMLSSRVHDYVEIEKKHYFVEPLSKFSQVHNEYVQELDETVNELYMRTIRCLIEEIDKFFSSWVAKEQR